MAETKPKKAPAKPRGMRPSTLLNHVEEYCKANDLGQDDTIQMLIDQIERDIVNDARGR